MRIPTQRASCKHLTYPYAAYLGCTLGEVIFIVGVYLMLDVLFSALLSFFMGGFFLFFLLNFVFSLFIIRLTARTIGRLKQGKQPGYVRLKIDQYLHRYLPFLKPSLPFLTRSGKWSKRRHLSC